MASIRTGPADLHVHRYGPAGSVIVIPLVVGGDDESLLDHIGFVGIAIRGVGVQVLGVQAGFVVGIHGLALFRRVGFGHPVIGANALDVVHGLKSLLTRIRPR
jgi:hypothetical protein